MDVLELVLPQAAAEFAKLPTVVRSVLRLCDGTRTLDEVCKISKLPQAREAVTRLQQLGLVAAKNGERKRRKNLSERTLQWLRNEDGFSNDEEAFFASSVEHLIEA
jgi:DNA-binding FadR family transcriptional regulator